VSEELKDGPAVEDGFETTPITVPDGTNIPFDEDVELALDSEDPTPVPGTDGVCWKCRAVVVTRIRNDARSPTSIEEARRYLTCVATQDDRWSLCAANLILRPDAGSEIYLGPERRSRLPNPSFTGPERRRVRVVPKPGADDD
jgi:hypothetical protein